MSPEIPGKLIILSGPRGAGKTALLQDAINLLRHQGRDIAGILSLAVEDAGQKIAIDGLDLRSGIKKRLAIRNTSGKGFLKTDQWSFDSEVMQWADEVLQASPPCDLLVVDELGVLEFERGQGWLSGMRALDEGDFQAATVVIRPELLSRAEKRWQGFTVIEVTPETRSAAREQLLDLLEKLLHSQQQG